MVRVGFGGRRLMVRGGGGLNIYRDDYIPGGAKHWKTNFLIQVFHYADLSLLEANLVLPHFCGLRASPNSNICEQSVFACGDCFHLWRTKEELQNCSCSTLHDCSPYCLYVDVLSKDCSVT